MLDHARNVSCIMNYYYYYLFLVIKEEAIDSRAEVKSFDKTNLKHVETDEKHFMPSAQGIHFVNIVVN